MRSFFKFLLIDAFEMISQDKESRRVAACLQGSTTMLLIVEWLVEDDLAVGAEIAVNGLVAVSFEFH